MQSIEGISDIVANLSDALDANIGVLAVVPNGIGRTDDQGRYLEHIRNLGFSAPVAIAQRQSLFEDCRDQRMPAKYYVHEVWSAYDYEEETLAQLDDLTAHIEEAGA